MKIIYIVNARIPTEKAHGYQICKMCEEFASTGAEIELWIPSRKNNIEADAFSFYDLRQNFKIKKIRSFDFLKYKIFYKPAFFLQNFIYSLVLLFKNIDRDAVIYTRDPEIAFIFKLRRTFVIFEAHTWPKSKKRLYNVFLKKTDKIIVITEKLKEIFIKNGFNSDKILVLPDAVDFKKFNIDISRESARKKFNLPTDKKIIMYAGHLYKWKGVDTLMESAKFLNNDFLILVIGGTEKDIATYKNLAGNYMNVSLLGYRPFSEIPYLLKAADFLILPNIEKEEISRDFTSPLKLFEYMASKRPIIASALPSIKEILNDSNSILIKPSDPEKLASAIKLLDENQDFAEKISHKAFIDVQKYTWEKRVEKILNIINKHKIINS